MNFKNTLTVIIIVISLMSCQITERVFIEEDGSGKFQFEIDMSGMIEAMSEFDDKKIDSNYVATDSIIKFSDILLEKKDSISKLPKDQREKLEKLKEMTAVIHEDKLNNKMTVSYYINFNNVSEIAEMQSLMSNADSMTNDKAINIHSKTRTDYSFKKNNFKRISKDKNLSETEIEEYDNSMKDFNMFMNGSTYNLEYHFPRAIKKSSAKNATFSEDKKVIYIETTMQEATDTPSILDFEVKLK